MRASEYQVIGEFISIDDLELAYNNLVSTHKYNVSIDIEGQSMIEPRNLKKTPKNKPNIKQVCFLLSCTLIAASLLGVFSLFSFWSPQNTNLSITLVCIFSMIGGFLGFSAGSRFMKHIIKTPSSQIQQGTLSVKVKTDKDMLQTKAVLHKSNAVKIKVL